MTVKYLPSLTLLCPCSYRWSRGIRVRPMVLYKQLVNLQVRDKEEWFDFACEKKEATFLRVSSLLQLSDIKLESFQEPNISQFFCFCHLRCLKLIWFCCSLKINTQKNSSSSLPDTLRIPSRRLLCNHGLLEIRYVLLSFWIKTIS